MKTYKVTTTITIETLSTDSVLSILYDVAKNLDNEYLNGELGQEDGDNAKWSTDLEIATI